MQAKDLFFLRYMWMMSLIRSIESHLPKKSLSFPSKCLQLVQVLKSHENHGIYCWNVFSTVGSTQQGLTKAETIQVKGDECLHIPHITVKDCFVVSRDRGTFFFTKLSCVFFSVRAVLKKREYGAKYTQNNFITAVRAMNEFCLKPRWPFHCILQCYASFIHF